MGMTKQASDPKCVISFLNALKNKENFESYKKDVIEKRGYDWSGLWNNTLKPAMMWAPNKLGVNPGQFYGSLLGAGVGALGGSRLSGSPLGGLTGGILGGLGGYYGGQELNDPIGNWMKSLGKNPQTVKQ